MFTSFILLLVFFMLLALLALSVTGILAMLFTGGSPARLVELYSVIRGLFKPKA